jgi:hypothetical protein
MLSRLISSRLQKVSRRTLQTYPRLQAHRNYCNEIKSDKKIEEFYRKESALKEAPGKAFKTAQAALAAGSVISLGSLCYYGLRLGRKTEESKFFEESKFVFLNIS